MRLALLPQNRMHPPEKQRGGDHYPTVNHPLLLPAAAQQQARAAEPQQREALRAVTAPGQAGAFRKQFGDVDDLLPLQHPHCCARDLMPLSRSALHSRIGYSLTDISVRCYYRYYSTYQDSP